MTTVKLEKPKSQIAEALYTLLNNKSVTRKQFLLKADILNAPESVRQLKNLHGVGIVCKSVPTTNKFGRTVNYGSYSLTNVKSATKAYLKLNKTEKVAK
jgi:hypothetical protein